MMSAGRDLPMSPENKSTGEPAATLVGGATKKNGVSDAVSVPLIEFGREVCGVLDVAEQREWLVTNGLGGYASGTVSGNLTRRYHGLLVAALNPPVGRTQLVANVQETVRYDNTEYATDTNRWAGGAVEPRGYLNIESFRLDGTIPVWRFACADALVEKRIWMQAGENTTYVRYTGLRGNGPIALTCKAFVNYRDFHSNTHAGNWQMKVEAVTNGVKVAAFEGATPFFLLSGDAESTPQHVWYRNCFFPMERLRGLDDQEDHLLATLFRMEIRPERSVTLVLTTNERAELNAAPTLSEQTEHEKRLLGQWMEQDTAAATKAPRWIQQLVLAADQFIVKRELPGEPEGRSIIAGYHWFGDWGRDTMIALPGLALVTGRPEIAKRILLAFARYVDGGMLPNNFPDAGGQPAYNTVDAALWFVEAVSQYFASTKDSETVTRIYPVLAQIIDAYVQGTRYHIHVDSADGLLFAGEPGVQLTWMDAKVGDWVVTPRIGKPVEVNALWYNALKTMSTLAPLNGESAEPLLKMAAAVEESFAKFWNTASGYCYDVIDAPAIGNDASLRPNQIFAVSLPHSPLSGERQKAVVEICARRLLTSYGLRSLAPGEPGYKGRYEGDQRERDAAYHQGTVWGWLLGPFVSAHFRVYRDAKAAAGFLEPLGKQIYSDGLGTLSEIFEGDSPFHARGCIAQAWTVGEVLRAWRATIG
jgi:predicted glycogen debranching enzyme